MKYYNAYEGIHHEITHMVGLVAFFFLDLLLNSYMALGEGVELSGSQFPHLK